MWEKSKFLTKDFLPESTGVLFFYKDTEIILSLIALDLKTKFNSLKKFVKKDTKIFSLFSKTTHFDFVKTKNLISALIEEQIRLSNQKEPEYNSYFYNKYAYFAIDYDTVPYFSIKEDTLSKEKIHIGPFHSRFFIWDFIIAMNELYLYPACESKEFPCKLYDKNSCIASCLANGIKEIALRDYLKVNFKKIEELLKNIESLNKELQFQKAENLMQKFKIIKRYYDYLMFFYVTKKLNYKSEEFVIKNGLIKKITKVNKSFEFDDYRLIYNDNEYLAIEKKQLNHRWIVYNFVKEKDKILIKEIYEERKDFYQ